MAWYPPLPQSGGTVTAGDEFLDDQSGGWPLWSFLGSADGHDHDSHSSDGGVRAASSGEQSEGPAVPPPQPTDDIFMSQFSVEEMRRMDDAPFEALDMFPGSMHQLLSYENMLSGVLTGSSEDEDEGHLHLDSAGLGVDTMDTCGFPLFSHELMQQHAPTEVAVPDLAAPQAGQAAASVTKRSRSVADAGRSLFLEAMVLQEFEDVVFQLTKRTRICFRDAFFRLAESSGANKCSAANVTTPSSRTAAQQAAEGNASPSSSISTAAGPGPSGCCPERATNAIDRTVADLTMKPPRAVPLEVDSGAEAQSATTSTWSWTTTTTAAAACQGGD